MNYIMNHAIYQVGDPVLVSYNGPEVKGDVVLVQGSLVTVRIEGGRKVVCEANFLTHLRPTAARHRVLPLWPIQKRRVLLSKAVEMVARGFSPSLIIVGQPGLGKTYEVTRTLQAMGLERDHDYYHVKGYTSARGLYETLFAHNGGLTVFDDCDNALNDCLSVELLKGALDSHDVRTISWLTAAKRKTKLPNSFEFTGQVIFITNRSLAEIDEAIHSRSLVIDFCMNQQEILEHMETILPTVASPATPDQRQRAMEFVREWAANIRQLNLRTLLSVLHIIMAHPTNWEELALYTVTK